MAPEIDQSKLDELCHLLRSFRRVMVMTGAGVSAESGIATFRGDDDSIWSRFSPHELATESAFIQHPERVWSWYQWRRQQIAESAPNPAHIALASLEKHVESMMLVTQNVDGLHQVAGTENLIELHGNIMRSKCHKTHKLIDREFWCPNGTFDQGPPPASPHHPDGLARPDVVWFGEALDRMTLDHAVASSLNCEVFFSIGTSAVVEPAASLATMARQQGACIVEINPQHTPLSMLADYLFHNPAGQILPMLIDHLDSTK